MSEARSPSMQPSHPDPLTDRLPPDHNRDEVETSEAPFQSITLPSGIPNPSAIGAASAPYAQTGPEARDLDGVAEKSSVTAGHAGTGLQKADMSVEKEALGIVPTSSISKSSEKEKHTKDDENVSEKPKKKGIFGRKKKDQTVVETNATGLKEKAEVPPVSLFTLYRYHTKMERTANVLGLILAAAAGATQPLMTLIFGRLTTSFTNFTRVLLEGNDPAAIDQAKDTVLHDSALNASYLVYIGIGMLVCTYGYMVIWQITAELASRRIRERFLKATLTQEISFFDDLGSGEVATRIESDTHLVHTGLGEKVPTSVQYISTFLTGFILAFAKSWRLALATSSMLPVIMVAGAIMGKTMTKFTQNASTYIADSGSLAEEVFSSIRTAQAFGAQKTLADLFDAYVKKASVVGIKGARISSLGLAIMFFVIYSGYALAFFYGAILINQNRADAGTVITVFLSILIGSFSMAMLAPELQAIGKARGGAAKLFAVIEKPSAIDSGSEEGLKPETCRGSITFENVRFNYPSRPDVPILKGLSTTFEANETTALVGASGSGKSSTISLIERFYDPLSGVVKLDGRDIRTLNVKWLRTQIGLVSQEPVLFGMTILKNIETGLINTPYENASSEVKFELIKQAAEKANAHEFIMALPEQYETDVGQAGHLLSGGQKQRVAIARAIVSNPPILLLDEATSALDSRSERAVQAALDEAAKNRTCIVVAHRLSTIRDANKILVVGAGEIIEQGTHNSLLELEGSYHGMVQAQKLQQEAEKAAVEEDSDSDDAATSQASEVKRVQSRRSEIVEKPILDRRSTRQSVASEVLAAKRAEEGETQENTKLYSLFYLGKRCYKINREGKWQYLLGFFASICTGAVYPALAVLFGKAINDFSLRGSELTSATNRNALWYFIVAILAAISIWVQQVTLTAQAEHLTGKLRTLYFKALIRHDIAFYDEDANTTGALTSSLSDNPQKVQGLAGVTLGTIIQSISTIVVGMILGLAYGPLLALIGIACIPLLVCAGYIRLHVVVLKDQKNKKVYSKTAHMASEAAGAIRTVASLTREEDCCREYHDALQGPTQYSIKSALKANLLYAVSQALSFWVIGLVFYVGSRWLASGRYSTQQFFTVLNSVVFSAIQAGNVFQFVPDASKAKQSCTTMLQAIDHRPEIDAESDEGKVLTREQVVGNMTFKDVHFRYPTRPGVRVLRGLDLEIPAGMSVALCGASGCGKSTTIGLVERFYDPLSGAVTLDGVNLEDMNINSFRSHMALVSQEPTLYRGSIRFNVLLGANKPAAEVTEEELIQACKDANIYDFIVSLPDGFDTLVGNKGSQLSGGQKQRIAIARALIRNPKILLLDEATSALDSQSELIVSQVLDRARRGRSSLIIAHRLSTIQNCDIICFFKEGKIVEKGSHQELLALHGGYYELVTMQTLSKQ